MSKKLALAVSVALATLSGCAVNTPARIDSLDLPSTYKQTVIASPIDGFEDHWWKGLNDPQLNDLVSKATQTNSDIKIAIGKIRAAEGALKGAEASFFPAFDLALDGSKGRQGVAGSSQYPMTKSTVGQVGMKYELDMWGRLADIESSNRSALHASESDRQSIQLTVISGVVTGYVSLRESDLLIQQYSAVLKNAEENESFVVRSVLAGLSTDIDLQAAETEVRDARALVLQERAQRDLTENALALLVGDQTLSIAPSAAGVADELPVPIPGLPSRLLASRPDVVKAQYELESARANVDVAKKAFFPQISLTGAIGSQSGALSSLMGSGSKIWSAGYGLDLPIFDGGLRVSNLWVSRAEQDIALTQYKHAVQTAFKEVNDSITSLNATKLLYSDARTTSASAKKVLMMQNTKFQGGILSYKELVAEDSAYRQKEILSIKSRFDYLNAWVTFNKSLGLGISPSL